MGHTFVVGPGDSDQRSHDHLVMAAAAATTMAVIVGSAVIAGGGLRTGPPTPPNLPQVQVTGRAQFVLDTLPLAYQSGDAVIVPAASDAHLDWVGAVPEDRIDGYAVPLGTRGLTSYADVPAIIDAPAWIRGLRHADRVFADVGPLWLACTRLPGIERCSASLLMRHNNEYYVYRSGVGAADFLGDKAPMEVDTYDAIVGGELRKLVVGGMGGTATEDVSLLLQDGSRVSALTSDDTAIPGETIWWATLSQPVESVTAYDGDGQVVAESEVPG